MPKIFIKIVGSTKPKNKLEETIRTAIEQLDQTDWPSRELGKFLVYQLFDDAMAAYTGKCTALRPTGHDHGDSFTFWVCDMLTVVLYDVKGCYAHAGQDNSGDFFALERFAIDNDKSKLDHLHEAYKNHLNTL